MNFLVADENCLRVDSVIISVGCAKLRKAVDCFLSRALLYKGFLKNVLFGVLRSLLQDSSSRPGVVKGVFRKKLDAIGVIGRAAPAVRGDFGEDFGRLGVTTAAVAVRVGVSLGVMGDVTLLLSGLLSSSGGVESVGDSV